MEKIILYVVKYCRYLEIICKFLLPMVHPLCKKEDCQEN